jgi:xanthine/CO dehydrogenase XdhC/CoxF family maturation factor/CTP:molybdopterin cytidylyltransferase MocA
MHELQNLLVNAEMIAREGKRAALATVVNVRGSAYRRPGARMLIFDEGRRTVGAISGGCLERDVCERARDVIASGKATLVTYDTSASDDIVWGLGLGCDGAVEVLIEPFDGAGAQFALEVLRECLTDRKPFALATVFRADENSALQAGARLAVNANGEEFVEAKAETYTPSEIIEDLRGALSNGHSFSTNKPSVKSYETAYGKFEALLEIIEPPPRIVIFGAGFDAQPLVRLARIVGMSAVVVDTQARALSRERFGEADDVLLVRPEEFNDDKNLRDAIDERAAVVIMSHNYTHDRDCLRAICQMEKLPRCIGVMGPKRRTNRMLDELKESGIALREEFLRRLHAPIGLDLGAETPEEIALSIIAEAQAALKNHAGGFLRAKQSGIHQIADGGIKISPKSQVLSPKSDADSKTKDQRPKIKDRRSNRQSKIPPIHNGAQAIRNRKIGIIILAAGASTRLGEPKQLLKFQNETLLRRAARAAIDSVAQPVVVVIGASAELMRAEISDLPLTIIENENWREGLSASLRVGLQTLCALDAEAQGAVVMLCDQPFVNAETINRLVSEFERSGALIVASEYEGARGVPALFERALFNELMNLRGREGAKRIIARYAEEARSVEFAAGATDIDSWADYEKLCAD